MRYFDVHAICDDGKRAGFRAMAAANARITSVGD